MAGETAGGPGMITAADIPRPTDAAAAPAPRFEYSAQQEQDRLLDGRDFMNDAIPMDIARPLLATMGVVHPERPAPAPRPQPAERPVYEYRQPPQVEANPHAEPSIDDAISREQLREILSRMEH